jgi:hypothetical protein
MSVQVWPEDIPTKAVWSESFIEVALFDSSFDVL